MASAEQLHAILLVYTRQHLRSSLDELRGFLAQAFPGQPYGLTVVDNALPPCVQYRTAEGVELIGGDNSLREFSGWELGYRHAVATGAVGPESTLVLANDTFHRSYGTEYLRLFRPEVVSAALGEGRVVGYVDAYPEPVELFGERLREWVRTSLMLLPRSTLEALRPFALPVQDEAIFTDGPPEFFRRDAPLSENYRHFLQTWLFGEADDNRGFNEAWHSQTPLTAENFAAMAAKARCILCEHLLSARAQRLGYGVFDVRRDVVVEGPG